MNNTVQNHIQKHKEVKYKLYVYFTVSLINLPPEQQRTDKIIGLDQPVHGRPILTRIPTITLRVQVLLRLLELLKMTITPVVVGVQSHAAALGVGYNPYGISLRILFLMWQVETRTLHKVTGFCMPLVQSTNNNQDFVLQPGFFPVWLSYPLER